MRIAYLFRNKYFKRIILFFLLFFLIKSILSYFVASPTIFGDEYTYFKMARSIFLNGDFSIHGIVTSKSQPLYPLAISLSYLFNDPSTIFSTAKIINSFLSSLIIFPAFLLAKEFLDKKSSFYASILISLLPSNFAISPYIMTENLFYTLALFSIYFIYKSFTSRGYKYDLLAGIFIGLSYLTRSAGLFLVFVVLITLLYKIYKKDYFEIKKKTLLYIISLLIVSPWLIRNFLLFEGGIHALDSNVQAIKYATIPTQLPLFSTWVLIYLGFVILATGIIFFMLSWSIKSLNRNQKIFLIIFLSSLTLIILVAANTGLGPFKEPTLFSWLNDRPIGRYVDAINPLVIIFGLLGLEAVNYKRLRSSFIITLIPLAFASQLIFFSLFPYNNLSISWAGSLKSLANLISSKEIFLQFSIPGFILFSTVILILLAGSYYIIKKDYSFKKIIVLAGILFLGTSLISYGATYYNSNLWDNTEQIKLSKFLKNKGDILIDERYGGIISGENQTNLYAGSEKSSISVMGFFVNKEIKVGNPDSSDQDILITREEFPEFELIKKTNNDIYAYKIK